MYANLAGVRRGLHGENADDLLELVELDDDEGVLEGRVTVGGRQAAEEQVGSSTTLSRALVDEMR